MRITYKYAFFYLWAARTIQIYQCINRDLQFMHEIYTKNINKNSKMYLHKYTNPIIIIINI